MKIAVITDNELKKELLAQGVQDSVQVQWLDKPTAVEKADCYIDLLFEPSAERINNLVELCHGIIIINAVTDTLNGLPEKFVRINGWATFLKRTIVEASCRDSEIKEAAGRIFSYFNRKTEWTPDVSGFISARVVSMIINEAYFTLEENVSSKTEIDTAMKLGTNYPYGPFEWSEKIGLKNVYELLMKMAQTNSRYEPCALLKKEIAG